MVMTSNRSYLIRAYFDWIVDNACTPYLSVNALAEGVDVPQSYVSEGQIVLNIAPRAVTNFAISDQGISFSGRFGGVPTDVYVPVHAVMGIYAQENGQGMVFQMEDTPPTSPAPSKPPSKAGRSKGEPSRPSGGKPGLRIVK